MAIVYVLSNKNKPLMPTERNGHVRWLLKHNLAKVINTKPFTIKLNYATKNKTQDIVLGLTEGRTEITASAVSANGKPILAVRLETRNKAIPKLMIERKVYRLKHRGYGRRDVRQRRAKANSTNVSGNEIKRLLPLCDEPITCKVIRNKKSRFCNRTRPTGWLTPTANHLKQTYINLIKLINRFLPITHIVLETNKYAFMEITNPNIKKWEYSKGLLHGFTSVNDAVCSQQDGKCLLCDNEIEHFHHIIPKSKQGSNTISNIAGLCKSCHDRVHKYKSVQAELNRKKTGLNKQFDSLSIINQINKQRVNEMNTLFPDRTYIIDKNSINAYKADHDLPNTDIANAYSIASSILPSSALCIMPNDFYEIKQFRRHDRRCCHKENVNRCYYLNNKKVAVNRHKATEQTSDSLEEYVANGGRTDNLTVKHHKPIYRRLNRVMPGALMSVDGAIKTLMGSTGLYNGIPQYYKFTDKTKIAPKHCYLLKQNTGLVFA